MTVKFKNKISVKLIISIFLILSIVLAVHTYFTTKSFERDLTDVRLLSAYNSSDIIKKSMRYSMLLNRPEDIHNTMNTIGKETGLISIRVYNKHGIIVYSADSTELNRHIGRESDVCSKCHTKGGNLESLSLPENLRFFKTQNNQRAVGLINPIKNEKECYTAPCHVHSPDVKILGVLDVIISLQSLDEAVTKNTAEAFTNSVIIILVISAFCGLFIQLFVNKPLHKITRGIDAVAAGKLDYKINLNQESELGEVANRFNDMSGKLELAYTEIKDFSDTLTRKVNEKTEELKKIYDQVIQIEKLASLGKLSATVAHELNNPLAGILTYSKLVSKKLKEQNVEKAPDKEKLIEYLELISDESARCGKIVKDLLLFSHRGEDVFVPENIKTIIDKSIVVIKHHLEIHLIALHKKYSDEEILVDCNTHKIQQALMALLINAIEAMPNGGKIGVNLSHENENAVIRISDTGTGIEAKDIQHIFEPFYTTKESGKGTGLGLAVVYGIIKQHNGNVEVEETSPKGTTFKVSIPLKFINS